MLAFRFAPFRPSLRGLVTATTPKKIKRFYEDVTVHQSGDFWHVLLDGKVVKTPRGTVLELPGKGVAKQVAMEWTAQETHLQPLEMPFTTIGCTALDITREDPAACVERLLPFLEMDTVCFQGDGEVLAERQQQEWGPLREWFQTQYGVRLSLASGLAAPQHPEDFIHFPHDRDALTFQALINFTDPAVAKRASADFTQIESMRVSFPGAQGLRQLLLRHVHRWGRDGLTGVHAPRCFRDGREVPNLEAFCEEVLESLPDCAEPRGPGELRLRLPGGEEETLPKVAEKLHDKDPWELCALEIATQTAKSLVVASALLDRHNTAEEILRLAQLEEDFQIERWGMVEGEHDITETEMLKWFAACREFGRAQRHAE
ncbi:unnamed protein product [Effrenium voratum]|nr:unnamed protein product [Effrenium voratum]